MPVAKKPHVPQSREYYAALSDEDLDSVWKQRVKRAQRLQARRGPRVHVYALQPARRQLRVPEPVDGGWRAV
jgi:hypothetical protein